MEKVFVSYVRKRIAPLFRRFSGPSFVSSRKRTAIAAIIDHIDILVSILEVFRFASELVSHIPVRCENRKQRKREREKEREREGEREKRKGRETPAQNGAER